MPVGRRPTLIVLTAPSSNVAGLKRSTVESPEFASQTAPLPTTIAEDTPPEKADAATRALVGSICAIVESPNAAQTEPPPTATTPVRAVRVATSMALVTRLNCTSTRETCPLIP